MADLSASPEPATGVPGLAALIAGVGMGFLVRRVLGAIRAGFGIARTMVERMADHVIGVLGAVAFSLITDPTEVDAARAALFMFDSKSVGEPHA